MTTETYLDLSYERGKGSKRHHRPKILKLSDVTIPHRSRKKSKVKTKDRSAILVRERIYDDPAYTEDISHLANPIRRGSVPGKHSAEHKSKSDISGQTASASSLLSRHQLTKDPHQYVSAKQSKYKGANSAGAPSGSTAVNVSYNCGSSSSDNATLEPTKSSSMTRRVRSLERSLAKERTDKKATQKRNSKQKRNLSLDNSRNLLPGHSQHAAQAIKQGYDFETRARRTPSRKKYTESSVEAAQTEASELDDAYSVRSSAKDSTATVPVETNAIGKRFLRGEIGIKSFNYYLLKEGLKSSKKLTGKQRSTLHSEEAYSKSEKMHSRSEENIYEEIFFKDTPSTATTSTTALATTSTPPQPLGKEAHNHPQQVQKGVEQVLPRVMSGPSGESDVGVFADCELCMEQCSKDSCEYCLDQAVQGARKNQAQPQKQTPQQEPFINQGYHGENSDPQGTLSRGTDPVGLPAAHILEFQSYNPNNPGVYKIETTPVAITGDYNPILQFQQSSATTSTSTTTTPGDQQQHIQPHQLQQPIYGGYYHPLPHQKPLHTTIVGNPLTRQYAVSGSLLLAQVAGPGSAPPRRPQQQQHYIVSYQNGGPVAGGASLQRLNTKSSSSSDSLPHHKYNTMTRMEANVFSAPSTGDLCYAVGGTAPLHPLMYAASRPIGGSQILIDPYDPPQMYKSDSKASILSEFSLRSSDNSQRYGPHRRHGGGRVSDSSIFSIYSNSGQRRYFGSSESRFGYDCRRCSLDGIIGMGSGTAMGATTAPSDKCSYSDNCRYECRNCDCSSNYFSSDFDDLYGSIARGGSSGIPRKTAAGTLPSSSQGASTDLKEKPPPPSLLQQQFSAPLDFKQNKYAQDFFKHVNDVKRSIYQSEMQRNNSFESSRRGPRAGGNNTNTRSSPKRAVSQEPILEPVVSTLPLSRGRPAAGVRPTPAPRTSLQSQPALPATSTPRDPTPTKRRAQPSGRREYPSLDRLVASNTGTIPKRHSRTMEETESLNPKFTSKPKESDAKDSMTGSNSEEQFTPGKRHHRSSGTKSHQNVPGPSTRRKDIPAPPPPSPATYSDLQELKANMEGLQDDTNSRSLESETSESPAVANPSVRSPTGSHNDKKTTRQLAPVQSARSVAPFKITIALTDMDIQAEFSTKSPPTVSISGHLDTGPNTGPDIGLLEQEDADVFYDARSEDSGAGILPTETCPPLAKGASGMVTCSQEAADGKMATENSKETNYSGMENSSKDVNTFLRTHPIAAGLEQTSNISGIQQGNDIGMASDDADSLKQGGGRVQEQITPYDVENQVGLNTGLQSHQWRSESEMTEVTLKGKCAEKTSKTIDDEETPTSAIDQHAAATCLEGQHTSLPATTIFHGVSTITNAGNISSNNTPAHSTRASSTDVDVYVEFSCTTANTDSPTLTHSDRNFLDIPLLQIAAGTPAQSRPLTRQDFACLDSSEAQSDDSHLTRDSVTRESQNDELSSSTLEKLDVSTLPLPAIPKRRRPRSRASPSKNLQHRQRHEAVDNANAVDTSPASSQQQHLKPRQRAYTPDIQKSEISTPKNNAANQKPQQHLSAFQQYVVKRRESLEASNRSFNEKLEARRMHGANSGVPTYLFGEHFQAGGVGGPGSGRKSLSPATNKEEIYLNKSGWVQVNTKRGGFKEDSFGGYRRQQNGGTASILQDNGRSRAAERYSLINQHQQQQSNFSIAEPKFVGSKVEELIQRNEARLGGFSSRDPALRPGYRIIDPQLASILNDRPGFLPVKSPNDLDSPITPILSPPPAFQDNSRTPRQVDRRKSSRQQAPLPLPMQLQSEAQQSPQHLANGTVKGMVFSRSFEYDARRPTPINSYVETFSRSFDGNLSERPLQLGMPLVGQRERSPNFSTLTGNSPNYLTKRESGGGSSGSLRSRDSSPKFLSPQTTTAYLNASVKEAPPAYNMSGGGGQQAKYSPRSRLEQTSDRSKIHALGRSRKSQFNRMGSAGPPAAPPSSLGMGVSRFRSFDTTKSQRLNSCDSGARSDLSNDELDNEDGFLSEFLSDGSQKFQKLCSSSVSISPFKMQRQRSLTPERNESHSSSSSLRKQRSLTPESRSLTPEERRKKGSQHSLLGSRQNSGTRSNTLEARPRHGDKTPPNISRSSSSSSYSGGELCSIPVSASGPTNHRRAMAAAHSAAKQAEQEHRIRRSRSLQLSERSPNRAHKSIVNVGISAKQSQQQPQQTPAASYRSSSNSLHQPPRQTGSPQSYGTRLCDHELTYEMLRKSPIMNFRRGDSSDYELPVLLRNRETINSGGNSELNFMSNETRIYEHPTTVLKPQRSLRQSPASRDDIPLEVAVGVGGDYIYRQAPSQPQSSSATSQSLTSTTTKSCSKTLNTGDYWPRCGACQEKAAPGAIQRQYSLSVVTKVDQEPEFRPHVTTVAVNDNITNVEAKAEKLPLPQWTFLCSGVANCRPKEQTTMTTNASERRQLMAVVRPRVVPLAPTSLVLMGTGDVYVAKAAEGENKSCPQLLAEVEIGLSSSQGKQDEFNDVNNNCRRRKRSSSLPRLKPRRYTETVESMPKTGNHGVKVVGIKRNAGGLSHQMRAVSSPSLTELYSESRKLPDVSTESADGAATVATSTNSGIGGGGVGLGVLLKFKRTLNNFNIKNQLHITPVPPTAAASNGNTSKPKSSPSTPSVSITTAGTVTTNDSAGTDGGDGSSGKYRFGPLIWRTSKERRKTKFNRRDKCNSGDSGIQIELEQDEQYYRVLPVGAQGEVRRRGDGGTLASISTSDGTESKSRTIRRTNSAKASSNLGSFVLKSKNHMHLDIGATDNIEREAPESLPTRSLSQPNGLETYGMGRSEMEDSDSDSVASHEEATSYYPTIYAKVLYNFTAGGPQELGLERGMLIEILRKEVGPWWFGRIKKEETNRVDEILDPELGWFPKEFVRIIQCPETDRLFNVHRAASEAEQVSTSAGEAGNCAVPVPVADFSKDADVTMSTDYSNITTIVIESPPLPSKGGPTGNVLDNETVLRRSAVRELLDTEVNYVKLLAAICDGYLPAMSKRIDIFSPNSIRLIFSNISAIYKFQKKFLEALRRGIEQNQISKVFLKMHKGFLCYSNYCNAYPRALIELESYDRVKDARTILENCRESGNLAELPLSAHLLAPVQRICRYPLHLNEVIKSALASAPKTGTVELDGVRKPSASDYEQVDVNEMDIPDTYDTVNLALEAMRGITEAVNEGKRHSETIARHQASFQNFKGPPLHLHSGRFFLQVDATRQKQNLWNSSYTLFLFDNQLVYCKRDIIKRTHFIYKGRIFLDRCRVVNVRDGKMFGHTIKNSLRIYCESRDKWYDFSFRSANRKHRFLSTLALERQFSGKALYVSEMTGFEYSYVERPGDFSDQSDFELPDFEYALCATLASGESSVPESPAKLTSRFCDTLPKKSQSRDGIASVDNSQMLSTATSTGSLGRRRIGNWFRKPKSTNCTPSQSPTHKSDFDADETLTAARVAAIELAEAATSLLPTDSSSA